MTPDESNSEQTMRYAQLEELRLKIEKLRFDLNELRTGKPWHQVIFQYVPAVTAIVAAAGFWWSLERYQDDQRKAQVEQVAQAKRDQDAREREYMKPWIENQRDTYRRALSAAGIVANTENAETRRKAAEEFWQLYHGEMILVETIGVSTAMVAFGECLDGAKLKCPKEKIDELSHALGSAMQDSMAATAKSTFQEFAANQFHYK
jgi:hypothetical protein